MGVRFGDIQKKSSCKLHDLKRVYIKTNKNITLLSLSSEMTAVDTPSQPNFFFFFD